MSASKKRKLRIVSSAENISHVPQQDTRIRPAVPMHHTPVALDEHDQQNNSNIFESPQTSIKSQLASIKSNRKDQATNSLDSDKFYATHPDLLSLAGFIFPDDPTDGTSRSYATGLKMFFDGRFPASFEHRRRLANRIHQYFSAAWEVATQMPRENDLAAVIRETMKSLRSQSPDSWGPDFNYLAHFEVMEEFAEARNRYIISRTGKNYGVPCFAQMRSRVVRWIDLYKSRYFRIHPHKAFLIPGEDHQLPKENGPKGVCETSSIELIDTPVKKAKQASSSETRESSKSSSAADVEGVAQLRPESLQSVPIPASPQSPPRPIIQPPPVRRFIPSQSSEKTHDIGTSYEELERERDALRLELELQRRMSHQKEEAQNAIILDIMKERDAAKKALATMGLQVQDHLEKTRQEAKRLSDRINSMKKDGLRDGQSRSS